MMAAAIYFPRLFRLIFEPRYEKTYNVVSEQVRHKPVCAVTEDSWKLVLDLEKKRSCSIRVAKTKALSSFAFVFAYTDCWFSDVAAHFI